MTRRGDSVWPEPANTCLAYNGGETDLRMFGAAAIVGSLISGSAVQYKRVLSVQTPAAGDEGRFVVCAEPIPAGRIGRVWVSGICPVWVVNETGTDALWADIADAVDGLAAADSGAAQILWEDTFTGSTEHLALMRFASPPGESGNVSVRVATTANITLSGTQTIDSVAVAVGDLVLAKDQSTGANADIWTVASGAWTRAGTLAPGMLVSVRAGTTNGGRVYQLTTEGPITRGTTSLTWAQVGGSSTGAVYSVKAVATSNLTLSGTQTIDGQSCGVGDQVLVTAQSTSSQNGVYTVAAGAWTKLCSFGATDATVIAVRSGTAYGETVWLVTAAYTAKATGGVYK